MWWSFLSQTPGHWLLVGSRIGYSVCLHRKGGYTTASCLDEVWLGCKSLWEFEPICLQNALAWTFINHYWTPTITACCHSNCSCKHIGFKHKGATTVDISTHRGIMSVMIAGILHYRHNTFGGPNILACRSCGVSIETLRIVTLVQIG